MLGLRIARRAKVSRHRQRQRPVLAGRDELGAERVFSFDYDPHSVACARELRRRYFPEAEQLDHRTGERARRRVPRALGQFDVVYSWGVLHHTGNMWHALANAPAPVAPGGRLFIAHLPRSGLAVGVMARGSRSSTTAALAGRAARARHLRAVRLDPGVPGRRRSPPEPFTRSKRYKSSRGMSRHPRLGRLAGRPAVRGRVRARRARVLQAAALPPREPRPRRRPRL